MTTGRSEGLQDLLDIFASPVATRGTSNTHLCPKLKVYCCTALIGVLKWNHPGACYFLIIETKFSVDNPGYYQAKRLSHFQLCDTQWIDVDTERFFAHVFYASWQKFYISTFSWSSKNQTDIYARVVLATDVGFKCDT